MKPPVQLVKAQFIPSCASAGSYTGLLVVIEVENLGFEKQVIVQFGDGQEKVAHYVRSLGENREQWAWTSPYQLLTNPHYQFSIRYAVNGTSYCDDNGGQNYHLDSQQTSIHAAQDKAELPGVKAY